MTKYLLAVHGPEERYDTPFEDMQASFEATGKFNDKITAPATGSSAGASSAPARPASSTTPRARTSSPTARTSRARSTSVASG